MTKDKIMKNDNKIAISYYRCASGSQKDCACSIEQQKQEVYKYCQEHGYRIIEEYEDITISGRREDRQALQKMLMDVEVIRPAYLILVGIDRLSRDRMQFLHIKEKLKDVGVEIKCVREMIQNVKEENFCTEIIEDTLTELFAKN